MPENDGAENKRELFNSLMYPTIGNFLAYQYATDINYSIDFIQRDGIVYPGPGVLMECQCFDLGDFSK